jgi:hypothetical protein
MQIDMFPEIEPKKKLISFIKPKIKKVAHRRYYLNRTIKAMIQELSEAEGFEIDTTERTIDVPYKSFMDIPIGLRYYVGECIKHQYNVQYKMF